MKNVQSHLKSFLKHQLWTFFLPFVILITIIIACNKYSLGISADSTHYFELAKNIANSKGIVNDNGTIVKHWPPLYPLAIASVITLTGLSVLNSALILNCLLSFLMATVFLSVLRKLEFDKIESVCIALLFFVSLPFTVFLWAWSEPLFFFFLSLVLWHALQFQKSFNLKHLVFVGVFSGLMFLTRYAGIGFIVGISLYYLLSEISFFEKLKRLSILFGSILITISSWGIFLVLNPTDATLRQFFVHIITAEKLKELLNTFLMWIVPNMDFGGLLTITFLLMIFYLGYVKKFNFRKGLIEKSYQRLLRLMITAYLAFLILSISFFDFHTPLDNRILGPIFFITILLLALSLPKCFFDRNNWQLASMIVFLLILISLTSINSWRTHKNYGGGFTHKMWNQSETLAATIQIKDKVIYSNGYDVISYHSFNELNTKSLPVTTSPGADKLNNKFYQDLKKMKNCVNEGDCVISYMDNVTWRWYLIEKDSLISIFNNNKVEILNDGFIISHIK